MGKNTGNGTRQGAVRDRVQYETKSGYVKTNTRTGEVVGVKSTPGPYKGVAQYEDGRLGNPAAGLRN